MCRDQISASGSDKVLQPQAGTGATGSQFLLAQHCWFSLGLTTSDVSDVDTDWQEALARQTVNAACNIACNTAKCQFCYPLSGYSLDKSCDYSQETEGNDRFQDLKEEAVHKVSAVFSFGWHWLMPDFDGRKEINTAPEQNWIRMYWLNFVTVLKFNALDPREESCHENA